MMALSSYLGKIMISTKGKVRAPSWDRGQWSNILKEPLEHLPDNVAKRVQKHRGIIKQYVRGACLQSKHRGDWYDAPRPQFHVDHSYRVVDKIKKIKLEELICRGKSML